MLTGVVVLQPVPSHERWPARAERDMARVRRALGPACLAVHHVGSTSVPGLHAVPVIDLVAELEGGLPAAAAVMRLLVHGFAAAAPEPSCTVHVADDVLTGYRQVELRCYPAGHEEVRMLAAFFALLRSAPAIAAEYDAMKHATRARHGAGSPGYRAEKLGWIRGRAATEPRAGARP
ncbi:MAG TPA: GrpB family protein [Acetobacteraceae bacterium]